MGTWTLLGIVDEVLIVDMRETIVRGIWKSLAELVLQSRQGHKRKERKEGETDQEGRQHAVTMAEF